MPFLSLQASLDRLYDRLQIRLVGKILESIIVAESELIPEAGAKRRRELIRDLLKE